MIKRDGSVEENSVILSSFPGLGKCYQLQEKKSSEMWR